MGRAGRGGGGGGSRGGGFGGSRGFGSHSGGSRSSWSSHSSGFRSNFSSSSYHHHYNSGPRFFYFGGTRFTDGYSGGYRRSSSSGGNSRFSRIITIVFLLIVMAIVLMPDGGYSSSFGDSNSSITKSTVDRKKLESSTLVESQAYYSDSLNWITRPEVLKSGMNEFYRETGVQPFLYITDDVESKGFPTDDELEKFGNKIYDKYFKDEAHLVVIFYEKDEKYKSCYITGTEAKTVIDSEAGEILLDYIDHYYYSNYDESEFFSRSFSDAAKRIMRVTPNYFGVAVVFILVIIVVLILFGWWKKKKKQKLDEMKQAQDILNSDLNEFGGGASYSSASQSSVDELKKKYDN